MKYNKAFSEELLELVGNRKYSSEDIAEIKSLLKKGADPNYQNPDDPDETPLVNAISCWNSDQRYEVVKILVEHGADVNKDAEGSLPIESAAYKNDIKLVNYLLGKGANKLEQALKTTIEKDNMEIALVLMDKGVNVDEYKDYNESFLSYCAEAYRLRDEKKEYDVMPGLKMAQLLIAKGASPNGLKDARINPLQTAISHDFIEFAELLLENGAKPIVQNDDLPILTQVRSIKMAELLIKHGAKLDTMHKGETTPLISAVFNRNNSLVKFFIDQGADIYELNNYNYTAFHCAVEDGSYEFVKFLLNYYDLDKCNEISPVLEIADNPKVLNLLKERMGIAVKMKKLSIKSLITAEGTPIFDSMNLTLESIKEELQKSKPELLSKLPDYKDFLTEEIFDSLEEQFNNNFSTWDQITEKPLQAIYMEHSGAVTDPYDGYALFEGFGECNDSLAFNGALFDSTGDLHLNMFFDGIDDLIENYDEEYAEITTYFIYSAYIIVHLVFAKMVKTDSFKSLKIKKPFYFVGGEHDQDKVLIYKHQ